MRVLMIDTHVDPLRSRTGDGPYAAGLTSWLRDRGHTVVHVGFDPFRGWLAWGSEGFRYDTQYGEAYARITNDVPAFWHSVATANRGLLKLLEERIDRYDLVHAHTELCWPALRVLATNHRIPLVYTQHTFNREMLAVNGGAELGQPLLVAFQDQLIEAAAGWAVPSCANPSAGARLGRSPVTARFAGNASRHVRTPMGPAPPAKDISLTGTRRVEVLFVGRLEEIKGLGDLLPRLSQLADRIRLTVVGDGPLRRELQELARECGLVCHFAGVLSSAELDEHYARADIFVCPSRHEVFCLSLSEAMQHGLAVVASDLPAFRDRLTDGVTGLVVDQSSELGWVHAVGRLVADSALRRRLGDRARESAWPDASWDVYEGLYDDARAATVAFDG